MILKATINDLPRVVDLGNRFHSVERWSGILDYRAEDFARSCERLIEHGAIFLSEDGLIGLCVSPSIYNHSQRVCSELFFWAPDGRGEALYRAAVSWAADNADIIVMSGHEPFDPRLDHWYRRKGFAPIGRQYARII